MGITTTVVNSRDEGSAGAVYIGRGSPLGNPFPIDERKGDTREAVIMRYAEKADGDPRLLEQMKAMRGKRLRCFCAPKPCHGDVVGFVAEGIESSAVAAARRVVAGETLAVYAASLSREGSMSGAGESQSEPMPARSGGIDFSKLNRPRSAAEQAAEEEARQAGYAALDERERRAKVKYERTMLVGQDPEVRYRASGLEIHLRGTDERGRPLRAVYETPFGYERDDGERLAQSIAPNSRLSLSGYFRPHTNTAGETSFTMAVMFMDGEGLALKGRIVSPRVAPEVDLPLTGPALAEAAWRAGREDQANLPEPRPVEIRVAVAGDPLGRISEEADRDGHRFVQIEGRDVATGIPVSVRVDSGFEAAIETLRASVSASPDGIVSVSGHWRVGPSTWEGDQEASFSALKVNGFDVARLSGVDNGRTETLDFQVRNLPPAVVASRYASAASFSALSGGPPSRGAQGLADLAAALPLTGGVVAKATVDLVAAAALEAGRSGRAAQGIEAFSETSARPLMLLASRSEIGIAMRALDPSGGIGRDEAGRLAEEDPDRRSPAAQSRRVVEALVRAGHAIAQPEFAQDGQGRYAKTGRVIAGPEGLASVASDFGRLHMRNVYLDPAALNRAVASMEPDAAGAFVAGVEKALSDSGARRADKELVSGRSAPSGPSRDRAGIGG